MQSQNSSIAAMLANKDDGDMSAVPASYKQTSASKNAFLLQQEEKTRFEHNIMAQCIKVCFKTNDSSSVVNIAESDCQVRCMAKGLESMALFEYLNVKNEKKDSLLL